MRKRKIGLIAAVIIVVALLASSMLNEEEPIIDRKGQKQILVPADSPSLPSRGFYKGVLPIPAEGQAFDEVYTEASHSAEFVPFGGNRHLSMSSLGL